MKHSDVYKIYKGGMKMRSDKGRVSEDDIFKPSKMSNKKLKKNLCEPICSYKQCISCEILGVCEYGNEAVRRKIL